MGGTSAVYGLGVGPEGPEGPEGPQGPTGATVGPYTSPFANVAPSYNIPTVTATVSTTVTNPAVFGIHDDRITEVGSRGTWNAAFDRWLVSGRGTPPGVDFYLTGTTVEFELVFTAMGNVPFWIWVDGQPCTAAPDDTTLVSPSAGGSRFLKLVFPSTARRRVEIFFSGGAALNAWRAVRVPTTDVMMAAPRKLVVGFIGDSFFGGSTPSPSIYCAPFQVSRLLGIECVNLGSGGSGYVAPGFGGVFGNATNVSIMGDVQPDYIVFFGSTNDVPFAGSVEAAATTCYAAYDVACPNTPLIVFGVQPTNAVSTVTAAVAATSAEVKAACAASSNVLAFYDMIGSADGLPPAFSSVANYSNGDRVTYNGSVYELDTPGEAATTIWPPGTVYGKWKLLTWTYTGTGNIAAPAGDGTRDQVLYSDGIHPTIMGSYAYTIHIANVLQSLLRGKL